MNNPHHSEPYPHLPDWLFWLYLLVLCWAPLPQGSEPIWSLNLLSLACLSLMLLTVLTGILKKIDLLKKLRPYWRPLLLLGLVASWMAFQCLPLSERMLQTLSPNTVLYYRMLGLEPVTISLEPGVTQMHAVFTLSLLSMFALTVLLGDSASRVRTLMFVIVASGVFQALYGSFMTLSGIEYGFLEPKSGFLGFATGTYNSRNHLAGYLEMCLAIGIGLLISQLKTGSSQGWREQLRRGIDTLLGPKMRLRLYLALMVIALVLTRSRMGNTAFFISLPLCGFVMMALQRKFNKGAIILFVSLILVDTLIVGQWFGFEAVVERLQETSVDGEERYLVNQDMIPMWQNHYLTGIGAGAFGASYSLYKSSEVDIFGFLHAHNDYLELAITLGLIGFVPLCLLVLLALYKVLKTLSKRHDQLAIGLAFASLMGIISLMIHSAVDFNLYIPANSLLFVVLLALGFLSQKLPRERPR